MTLRQADAGAQGPEGAAGGLTQDEAARRLLADGPNLLPTPPRTPAWRRYGGHLVDLFSLMLWGASFLAFIGGLLPLSGAIVLVVLLNATFAFIQQNRAEHAAERLHDLLPRWVTVVRDGKRRSVAAGDLVRGDTVVLDAGDRISADLEVTQAHGFTVDSAAITGESFPEPAAVGDQLWAGTFAVEGEATATVTATGSGTRLAGIAGLTQAGSRPAGPLTLELHRVVRTLAVIASSIGVAFFLITLAIGTPARDGFLFAVGVTVAVVPCGLLPTMTLSLAAGAQRMAHRNALVRRLEAVETLGSTTFICSDKTGTLTRNEMAVVEVWTPAGGTRVTGEGYVPEGEAESDSPAALQAALELAAAAARCASAHLVQRDGAWVPEGDPMEVAIEVLARRLGAPPHRSTRTGRRFPFDPRRRRMSVVVGDRLVVKGATDAVLPCCAGSPAVAQQAMVAMAERGLRVLAIAVRPASEVGADAGPAEAEQDLTLLGLVGLEDPPRGHAAAAVAACRSAGLSLAMITGDHPATARAIAEEVGLWIPGAPVLVGAELPADEAQLGALVDHDGVVLSRISPEDKLRIARALRARGHVVAMTGDGVNDGPALQEADIGVAMGLSGTDVAREAADLVLLDDDFATIVVAIEQGRATFANLRRFLTYHLTDNVAELAPFMVWALSGGRFPLALGVLQVLALDIGTDTLPAVALGAEAPAAGVLDRAPIAGRLINRTVAIRAFGVLGPIEAGASLLVFVAAFLVSGWRPGEPFPEGDVALAASGAAFATVVVGQMANALACRSATRPAWKVGRRPGPALLGALGFEALILGAVIAIPPVASLLGQAPPPAAVWPLILLAAPLLLVGDAVQKVVRARRSP
jgi:magnesium-transporting ATPase (P-type)